MKLGFIGTGKITYSVVTGICRSKISFKKIILSPRNRSVARKLKSKFSDKFYLEIQRHNDQNEIGFEKFNLKQSLDLEIPIIATNEVFYLSKDMHEAHDALICIGEKQFIDDKNRFRYSDQHYLKKNEELKNLKMRLNKTLL